LLPDVRCSWHDRAQLSTTESRKVHAFNVDPSPRVRANAFG
jgi:hypothetical protein